MRKQMAGLIRHIEPGGRWMLRRKLWLLPLVVLAGR
jgi:hypothetical protein